MYLAPALKELTSLKFLDLGDNDLNSKAIENLLPSLAEMKLLENLDFQRVSMSFKTTQATVSILENLPKLKVVNFYDAEMKAKSKALLTSSQVLSSKIIEEYR